LIPASAHGTNPASAAMAGMKIIVTKTMENGNIDRRCKRRKALQYKDQLSCLMITLYTWCFLKVPLELLKLSTTMEV
jgi:glycine dehydrogenase